MQIEFDEHSNLNVNA